MQGSLASLIDLHFKKHNEECPQTLYDAITSLSEDAKSQQCMDMRSLYDIAIRLGCRFGVWQEVADGLVPLYGDASKDMFLVGLAKDNLPILHVCYNGVNHYDILIPQGSSFFLLLQHARSHSYCVFLIRVCE
jgi:hypothetical protein